MKLKISVLKKTIKSKNFQIYIRFRYFSRSLRLFVTFIYCHKSDYFFKNIFVKLKDVTLYESL